MKSIDRIVLILSLFVAIVILFAYFLFKLSPENIGNIGNTIAGIAGLIGLIYIGFQFKSGNNIARADFIYRISNDIEKYQILYDVSPNGALYDLKDSLDNNEVNKILECLGFYEKVKSIMDNNVLAIELTDKLFGYRFFYFAHNSNVKSIVFREDVKPHLLIFFELYRDWYNYRVIHKMDIPRDSESFIDNI